MRSVSQRSVAQFLTCSSLPAHASIGPPTTDVDAFQTESMLYLVMPYVGGGDLFRVLDREGTIPEYVAFCFCFLFSMVLVLD